MRVAIIDLGTNSVRFDVQQIGLKARVRQLHREKLMVRLGQGVFLDGKLDPEAIRRTLHAFISFERTAKELNVDRIIAFATSALREAADSDKLLQFIHARTGIEVRVISGAEEARLIGLGILNHEKLPKGRFGLIDIGGGSTEISLCRGKKMLMGDSFPLGTARLQQVFLKSSPPKPRPPERPLSKRLSGRVQPILDPIEQLRRYIKSVLLPKMVSDSWPKVVRVTGSSGTIKALARIVKKTGGGKTIDRGELKKLIEQMSTMTTTQLLGLPGMEAKRVDMILAGAILLEECMIATGAKKVFTTDFSLRDGILDEQIKHLKDHKARSTTVSFQLEDVKARAVQLTRNPTHLDQVITLSSSLFDFLAPLHKLKPDWKNYLVAAAMLHDVGELVSPVNHERHSYYIVKNAEFPAMEKWENDFIAQLCLKHRMGKIASKELPFGRDLVKKEAFIKLLAMLRIADALDRGHKAGIQVKGAKIERSQVTLAISARSASDLELLRVEQKKELFELTFRKSLVIQRVQRAQGSARSPRPQKTQKSPRKPRTSRASKRA